MNSFLARGGFVPLLLSPLALLALALVSCRSVPSNEPGETASVAAVSPPPTDQRVVLVARGMACPKCVTNADLQLMKIDGVRSVSIDMKHGFITVEIDPAQRPSREAYASAIDAAGLTLVSVHEATPSQSR